MNSVFIVVSPSGPQGRCIAPRGRHSYISTARCSRRMITSGRAGIWMSLPTQTNRDMDLRYDARVAGAMNRVLEAERSAQSAVADCEQRMLASLEHARQQRRTILQRAHERIMALQARVAGALGQRTSQIREQHGGALESAAVQGADRARLQAAIERLAERLTCVADGDR